VKKNVPDLSLFDTITGFPEPLTLSKLQKDLPYSKKHTFSKEQCEAIHRVFDLESLNVNKLESFRVDVECVAFQKTGIEIKGSFRARIHQKCVVTLEPIVKTVHEDFSMLYLPQFKLKTWFDERPNLEETLMEENPPELLPDSFDITQIASENLILAIDPYVRKNIQSNLKTTAAPPGKDAFTDADMKPFAVLATLKDKLRDDNKS
jgi:hypothetical protein